MIFNKIPLSASLYDKNLYDMTSLSDGQSQESRHQYVVYAYNHSLLYFKQKPFRIIQKQIRKSVEPCWYSIACRCEE